MDMLAKVFSVAAIGLDTITVEVEVNAGSGEPNIHIVGLPSKAVQESQERVKTALVNCGIKFPAKRVTINLAPADIPKEGPLFDLPIALGVLQAFEMVDPQQIRDSVLLGELSLDGGIRAIKGILPAVLHAKKNHFSRIIIPYANAAEVEIISDIAIHPLRHIMELIEHCATRNELFSLTPIAFTSLEEPHTIDFADVHGQEQAKRALTIAAAGGHNILMNGSPGSGKSMLAKALISILPPLTEEEAIEITSIHSLAGIAHGLQRTRPFRAPHHTTSQVGLIGGGTKLKPGEISLAHRGVLFLDEFPEFSHQCVESLRQPLEDHVVQLSRASGSTLFPAEFTLVAAANPCPCGYAYSQLKRCSCSPLMIERYQKRLSGPILDRIDLHIHVQEVPLEKLTTHSSQGNQTSKDIRTKVNAARQRQLTRYAGTTWRTNTALHSQAVKQFCTLAPDAQQLLYQGAQKFQLSARSYFKVVKVAQTIADLDSDGTIIEKKHIAEALQYRGNATTSA